LLTTRPQYGHRSLAPAALLFSSVIRMVAPSSRRTDKRVAALVYICAFAPEDGDTTLVDQDKYPATPIFQHIEVVEGSRIKSS
jgi:hypothetical protein